MLKRLDGTIEAESETAAIRQLGNLGVYPLTITEAPVDHQPRVSPIRHCVSSRALADMSRQLADLLNGGVPLANALSLISQQTEHRALREVMTEVALGVRDGQALSEGLSRYPPNFSPLFISMVKAGEAGGNLDAVLTRLADVLDGEAELKAKVASALVYPLVVLGIGLVTIVVLLTYVVPKLSTLFAETGQSLPLSTRALLAASESLSQWWWAWLGGIVIGLGGVRMGLASTGWAFVDRLTWRMPLWGELIRKLDVARLTRNVGVMMGQGVPVLQALDVASTSVSSLSLRQAILRVKEETQEGKSLAHTLTLSGAFPAFVSSMVAIGEESGTLEAALLKIAARYEREADQSMRLLVTVLEPTLIVAVGLIVMVIVISMLVPIFQLGLVAQ